MAAGRFNTMVEGLQKVAADLTVMMAAPDADLEFLTEVQTLILGKLREPYREQVPSAPNAGQGTPPPEIAAMMGGQTGAVGIPGAGGGGPVGGMGGPMVGPGNPNPDELRRLMGG